MTSISSLKGLCSQYVGDRVINKRPSARITKELPLLPSIITQDIATPRLIAELASKRKKFSGKMDCRRFASLGSVQALDLSGIEDLSEKQCISILKAVASPKTKLSKAGKSNIRFLKLPEMFGFTAKFRKALKRYCPNFESVEGVMPQDREQLNAYISLCPASGVTYLDLRANFLANTISQNELDGLTKVYPNLRHLFVRSEKIRHINAPQVTEVIEARACYKLETVNAPKVKKLDVRDCEGLLKVDAIGAEQIDYSGCSKLPRAMVKAPNATHIKSYEKHFGQLAREYTEDLRSRFN